MAYKINVSGNYATHLPCLIKALEKTNGDILEMGAGVFSTPYLHYASILSNRHLVTYENYKDWFDFFIKYGYECSNHELHYVEKYSDALIDKNWDVVLIDQTPDSSRSEEAIRLKDKAKYIILHDANPSNDKVTHYSQVYPHFRYKTTWTGDKNSAVVVSNLVDLADFWL